MNGKLSADVAKVMAEVTLMRMVVAGPDRLGEVMAEALGAAYDTGRDAGIREAKGESDPPILTPTPCPECKRYDCVGWALKLRMEALLQ